MDKKITLQQIKDASDDWGKHPINIRILGPFSSYVAYIFARFTPLTPNQISFTWGFLGVVACFFIGLGGYSYMVFGAILYHFAVLLDYVDGEIAKAKKITTIGGTYLDRLFHYIHRGLLVLALGWGIYNTNGNIAYLYLGISTSIFLLLDNLNKLKVYETFANEKRLDLIYKMRESYMVATAYGQKKGLIKTVKDYTMELLRPNNPFSFLFITIVFNIPGTYLILMSIITPIVFLKNLVLIYRKIGNISTKKKL
ncbi:CDP-alcohol phosphatidyltransferase family protein [Nanoarchaeota archaeon]